MEPNRLIIELVRDRLRAAWKEQIDLMQRYSQVMGHWRAKSAFDGFTKDGETILFDEAEFADVCRSYDMKLLTTSKAIENWERALTVALDKLV